MAKNICEFFMFAAMSVNAALLIFFAGVYREIMDALDAVTFKKLTDMLVYYSSKSFFMITVLNLPLIFAVPYYYFAGFGNWWNTAGLTIWLLAGTISKIIKLPVYKKIAVQKNEDVAALNEMRNQLNNGNLFQACLYSISTIIMAVGIINK